MVTLSWRRLTGVRQRWAARIGLVAAIAILLILVAERWAMSAAGQAAGADARQLAASNAALFNSELQKFRLLPVALAEYPDVSALLERDGKDAVRINDRLERLATKTDAAAIYVIRPDGLTIAASNYRQRSSFVGRNYAFRPYFIDALAKGDAELFALGTVSGRPGLYLARRIGDAAQPLGVIVVKVEFDDLEAEWARQIGTSIIADDHSIVIVSGRQDWRFRALRELTPAERTEIDGTRQFEGIGLDRLPVNPEDREVTVGSTRYRTESLPIDLAGGRLFTLMPMDRAIDGARAQARVIVVLILALLAGFLAWQFRQQERAANQEAIRRELEFKVAERTQELEQANSLLRHESQERAAADKRYRRSREELAQANRLGTLGQIAAGVAHELNQPVAAIRAFAENGLAFLDRKKPEKADENLRQIVALTERIAAITAELRSFARRKTPAIGPVSLADAIDGAMMLVKHRLDGSRISLEWDKQAAQLEVRADRIRLEQVLVNLIQNSLDAIGGAQGGRIELAVSDLDNQVILTVADNGPGLAKGLRPRLFTPFATSKDQGLGLGLAIVRDIMRGFGGDITYRDEIEAGTCFELSFAKA